MPNEDVKGLIEEAPPQQLYESAPDLLKALRACLDFIGREYADNEASALDGHPIAREARSVWNAGWEAVARAWGREGDDASEKTGDGSTLPPPTSPPLSQLLALSEALEKIDRFELDEDDEENFLAYWRAIKNIAHEALRSLAEKEPSE